MPPWVPYYPKASGRKESEKNENFPQPSEESDRATGRQVPDAGSLPPESRASLPKSPALTQGTLRAGRRAGSLQAEKG